METFMRLSKGLRRHIRQEKAAIRRQFNNTPEAEIKMKELISKFVRIKKSREPKKSRGTPKKTDSPN